jgi:hypothetical protein
VSSSGVQNSRIIFILTLARLASPVSFGSAPKKLKAIWFAASRPQCHANDVAVVVSHNDLASGIVRELTGYGHRRAFVWQVERKVFSTSLGKTLLCHGMRVRLVGAPWLIEPLLSVRERTSVPTFDRVGNEAFRQRRELVLISSIADRARHPGRATGACAIAQPWQRRMVFADPAAIMAMRAGLHIRR